MAKKRVNHVTRVYNPNMSDSESSITDENTNQENDVILVDNAKDGVATGQERNYDMVRDHVD